MARRGRPTVEITLSADERATLQRWARRHRSSPALALRCRIVLACADGDRTHGEIAAELGCNPATISKWRNRFAVDRLDGLGDAPRPGAARRVGDDVVEAVVVETLETAPPDATTGPPEHWRPSGWVSWNPDVSSPAGTSTGPPGSCEHQRHTCDGRHVATARVGRLLRQDQRRPRR
jgi:transposase-like protein